MGEKKRETTPHRKQKRREKMKKQITKDGVVKGGIYVVPDTIEVKPDKDAKEEIK